MIEKVDWHRNEYALKIGYLVYYPTMYKLFELIQSNTN
jgi:hypothetical protein